MTRTQGDNYISNCSQHPPRRPDRPNQGTARVLYCWSGGLTSHVHDFVAHGKEMLAHQGLYSEKIGHVVIRRDERDSQPAACRFRALLLRLRTVTWLYLPCVLVNLVPNTIAKCGVRRRCSSARSRSRYQRLDAMLRPKSVMVAAPGLLVPIVF